MKEIIRKQDTARYGYVHVIVSDDGKESVRMWLKRTPDNYLFFNGSHVGRKCVSIDLLDSKLPNNGDEMEVTLENLSKKGTGTSTTKAATVKVPLENYLDEEDRKLFLELIAKANRNKAIAEKKAEIERLMKELETLA